MLDLKSFMRAPNKPEQYKKIKVARYRPGDEFTLKKDEVAISGQRYTTVYRQVRYSEEEYQRRLRRYEAEQRRYKQQQAEYNKHFRLYQQRLNACGRFQELTTIIALEDEIYG